MSLCALAIALAGALPAQQASFTTFGTGCNIAGERNPTIVARGLPRVGTTFRVVYSGPNTIEPGIGLTEQPILVAGASRLDFPVPPIRTTQPTGCTLIPFPDVIVPMPAAPGGRSHVTDVAVPIPNDPSLFGATVFLQWMTPHIQCTFVGCDVVWIAFSDGARAVLGS